jgi:hypothetical protein
MKPGIYMGTANFMNGYKLYDVVNMKFFECLTAVFDKHAFGFAQLIERVSGPPMVCPKKWLAKLNKEWKKEKHAIEATKDVYEDGYMREGDTIIFETPDMETPDPGPRQSNAE